METPEQIFLKPLQLSLERLQDFLPQLFAAAVIFACGLLLGWLIKALISRVLAWSQFDAGCQRLGLTELLGRGGVGETPRLLLARLGGGLVVLIFALLALGSFDFLVLQHLTERFLAYLPHVIVAGAVVVVAMLLGSFVGRAVLIGCVNAGNRQARMFARLARLLVVALGVVMALEQLGIGKETVLLAFGIAFGGVVLALAIAFGLGGRGLARDYLQEKLRRPADEDKIEHL